MDQTEQKHKRRVRYSGTHPKSFQEKYKELQPEKYEETLSKVIQKGNTPAGMHRPICVNEIMDVLMIKPGEIGLDATLGYGGHSMVMLSRLENNGHLYCIDADPIELPKTKERLEKMGYGPDILSVQNINFSKIDQILKDDEKFDFVLADLGVSSMQIDNPERGFSFKQDGPLDLRMNPLVGLTAAQRLRSMKEDEIVGMLSENADEPHADIIARGIVQELRKGQKIETTKQLQKVIADALKTLPIRDKEEEIKKACQRSFQALRIDVNREYDVLFEFLDKLPKVLSKGGRVAILSFHSGEDRLVKKSFQYFYRLGEYSSIAPEFIRPTFEEQNANSRSRSAKLRWAIKA